MQRNEIINLKLQMGIDPAAHIDSNVLLTMWQQLQIESKHTERNLLTTEAYASLVASSPMDV